MSPPFVPFPKPAHRRKLQIEQHLGEGCLGKRPMTLESGAFRLFEIENSALKHNSASFVQLGCFLLLWRPTSRRRRSARLYTRKSITHEMVVFLRVPSGRIILQKVKKDLQGSD